MKLEPVFIFISVYLNVYYLLSLNVVYLLSPSCSQIVYYCVDGKCECFHSNYKIISISNRMCLIRHTQSI